MNKLEYEGKLQIDKVLKDTDINIDYTKNKCSECPYKYIFLENQYCALDNRSVNTYGCNEELLGNNAERIINYPDDGEDR